MKRNIFLAVGMFSLALSHIIDRFVIKDSTTDFIIGFLVGLSIVFTTASLILSRKKEE